MAGTRRRDPAIRARKTFLARPRPGRARPLPVLLLPHARRFLFADALPGRRLEKDADLALANLLLSRKLFPFSHSPLSGDRRSGAGPDGRRIFSEITADLSGLRGGSDAVLSGVG